MCAGTSDALSAPPRAIAGRSRSLRQWRRGAKTRRSSPCYVCGGGGIEVAVCSSVSALFMLLCALDRDVIATAVAASISSRPCHRLRLASRCREVPVAMVRLAVDDSHVMRCGRANIPASRCDSMRPGDEASLAHAAIGQAGLVKVCERGRCGAARCQRANETTARPKYTIIGQLITPDKRRGGEK